MHGSRTRSPALTLSHCMCLAGPHLGLGLWALQFAGVLGKCRPSGPPCHPREPASGPRRALQCSVESSQPRGVSFHVTLSNPGGVRPWGENVLTLPAAEKSLTVCHGSWGAADAPLRSSYTFVTGISSECRKAVRWSRMSPATP